jgi:hypothetical protein
MLAFAQTTGALQPGKPCAPGIAAGTRAPAVCSTAVDLVPTLESLAAQEAERVPLEVVEAPASAVMQPGTLGTVDLRRPAPVQLPVTYSCVDQEPGTYASALEVRLRGKAVATLTAQVECLARPETAGLPPAAAPAVAAVVALPLLPPAAPPPPPPAQGTQVQTQTQPQTQVQSQVQSGTQEEEQVAAQLALAAQESTRDEGVDVQAMSARRQPVPTPVWLLTLTALTAVAGAAAVHRQQRAVAVAREPVGRGPATRR